MNTLLSAAAAAAVSVVALAGCGSADNTKVPESASSAESSPSMEAAKDTMTTKGAYLSLKDYKAQMADRSETEVVYFFHASWCPDCRATEESLVEKGVPDGLTVVKLDYDSETDLREKYGVTQQHTFVHVDASGKKLHMWSGSKSGAEIARKAS